MDKPRRDAVSSDNNDVTPNTTVINANASGSSNVPHLYSIGREGQHPASLERSSGEKVRGQMVLKSKAAPKFLTMCFPGSTTKEPKLHLKVSPRNTVSNDGKYVQAIPIIDRNVRAEVEKPSNDCRIEMPPALRNIRLYPSVEYKVQLAHFFKQYEYISNSAFKTAKIQFTKGITQSSSLLLDELLGFDDRVAKHNADILFDKYCAENDEQLKNYIVDIGFSKCQTYFDYIVTTAVLEVQTASIFPGSVEVRDWVQQILHPLKEACDELGTCLMQIINNLWNSLESHNFLEDETSALADFSQEVAKVKAAYTNLDGLAEKGVIHAIELMHNIFQFQSRVWNFGVVLAHKCNQICNNYMKQLLGKSILSGNELKNMCSEMNEFILIPEFTSYLIAVFEVEVANLMRGYKIGGDFKNNDGLLKLYYLLEKGGLKFFQNLLNDSFLKFSATNSFNVKAVYKNSLAVIQKYRENFEATLVKASKEKCDTLEFRKAEKYSVLAELQKELLSLKYAFKTENILKNFEKDCESYFEAVQAQREVDASLRSEGAYSNTKRQKPKCLVVDLNFERVKVAESTVSHTTLEVEPFWMVTASGEVLIGDSSKNINSRLNAQMFELFYLRYIMSTENLNCTYSSFSTKGHKLDELKPDEILALFIHKLKKCAESSWSVRIENIMVVVPLRFTMKQRFVINQATKLSGFSKCTLINDTTAVAFDILSQVKLKAAHILLVETMSDDLIDYALYDLVKVEKENFAVHMIHSYCNIPKIITQAWYNEQGALTGSTKIIIDYIIGSRNNHNDKKQVVDWRVVNLTDSNSIKFLSWHKELDPSDKSAQILTGGCHIHRCIDKRDNDKSCVVRECIPYPILAELNTEQIGIFPCNSEFLETSISIQGESNTAFTVFENLPGNPSILCRFQVKAKNPWQFKIGFSLDENGLLRHSFPIDFTSRNDDKPYFTPPDVLSRWELNTTEQGNSNLIPKEKKVKEPMDELKVQIEGAILLINDTEIVINNVKSMVQKKFLRDAVTALKEEIASDTRTLDRLQIHKTELQDLLQKFKLTTT